MKQTEALKLALEALKDCRRDPRLKYEHKFHDKVIKALEEALAKQEQGEPSRAERLLAHVEDFAKRCGWSKESGEGAFECVQRTSYAQGVEDGKLQPKQEQGEPVMGVEVKRVASGGFTGNVWWIHENLQEGVFHLYTTPQQRKPLTDEQIEAIAKEHIAVGTRSFEEFARRIEAAHGIRPSDFKE